VTSSALAAEPWRGVVSRSPVATRRDVGCWSLGCAVDGVDVLTCCVDAAAVTAPPLLLLPPLLLTVTTDSTRLLSVRRLALVVRLSVVVERRRSAVTAGVVSCR